MTVEWTTSGAMPSLKRFLLTLFLAQEKALHPCAQFHYGDLRPRDSDLQSKLAAHQRELQPPADAKSSF